MRKHEEKLVSELQKFGALKFYTYNGEIESIQKFE